MRTDTEIKKMLDLYLSLPKSQERTKLGKAVRSLLRRLIKNGDYVGIIHIIPSLGDYEKDRLFSELLERRPESSLFVLAFADADMHCYDKANKIEHRDGDFDEEALRKDVELTFDTTLCQYLSRHSDDKALNYVQFLTDGATWLSSYKRSTALLCQQWEELN